MSRLDFIRERAKLVKRKPKVYKSKPAKPTVRLEYYRPEVPFGSPLAPLRFWERVKQDDSGCWTWQGSLNKAGYGQFYVDGRNFPAHRFSWDRLVAPLTKGLTIDHLCRSRACVNPAHLEEVTLAENAGRALQRGGANGFDLPSKHKRPDLVRAGDYFPVRALVDSVLDGQGLWFGKGAHGWVCGEGDPLFDAVEQERRKDPEFYVFCAFDGERMIFFRSFL